MTTVWITYTTVHGGGPQTDRTPNSYRNVSVHTDELSALRYANAVGARAVQVPVGTVLDRFLSSQTSGR